MTEIPRTLTLETRMPAEELQALLKKWEPWRHEIRFSNGVKTSQFRTATPYTDRPLGKLKRFASHVPLNALHGARALDIGCNVGYNSVYLAQTYNMRVTGIDIVPRHLEVSRFLGTLIQGGSLEFLEEDATFFVVPEEFDLILHFGTLYHLPNPLLSIKNAARSLKRGGYFALETSCYTNEDPGLCKWMRGVSKDKSNFWALSKPVLEEILGLYGFAEVRLLSEVKLPRHEAEGTGITRVMYFARK